MNKKRIALIVDEKNWAFDIEANLLKEKLKDFYNINVFVSSESIPSSEIIEFLKKYTKLY